MTHDSQDDRSSRTSILPPGEPPSWADWMAEQVDRMQSFVQHFGAVTLLSGRTLRALFTTRFEPRPIVYHMEQLGLRSLGIAAATAVSVGVVMAIQFAVALEKFGAQDTVGRIIGISEARELAPALTSLVVGSRIGAGMAAEIGSMMVTEQVDAIRALGADPIKKLVVPRLVAGTVVMPLLTCFALVLGVASAMVVTNLTLGTPMSFFLSSALDTVSLADFRDGLTKTPFFGFLIALLGCHFGLGTRGGTEGVGRSTTSAVVVVAITLLVADALLTQLLLTL